MHKNVLDIKAPCEGIFHTVRSVSVVSPHHARGYAPCEKPRIVWKNFSIMREKPSTVQMNFALCGKGSAQCGR